MKSGVSAMIQAAVWFENTLGMETLFIGRHGLDRKDTCLLEVCGRHLEYLIKLDGGFVFVSALPLDSLSEPEPLLSVADGQGWPTICKLSQGIRTQWNHIASKAYRNWRRRNS
jgi:hypothetical protein